MWRSGRLGGLYTDWFNYSCTILALRTSNAVKAQDIALFRMDSYEAEGATQTLMSTKFEVSKRGKEKRRERKRQRGKERVRERRDRQTNSETDAYSDMQGLTDSQGGTRRQIEIKRTVERGSQTNTKRDRCREL